jgi:hypothetical protein
MDAANLKNPVVTGVIDYLRSHALGYQVAKKYKIGCVINPEPGDERFYNSLSIPYLTRHGPRAIKYRMLTGKQKFDARAGQAPRLYNTVACFSGLDYIGIAEGEIDAIVATEKLGIPTLGVPGTEMWNGNKHVWKPLFKDFETVFVFADGDPENEITGLRPGAELAKNIADTIGMRVRIIQCPEGWDVSSMVAAGKAQELIDGCKLATS